MGIHKTNLVTSELSGRVGRQLVFRNCKGQTVVASRPRRSGKVSETQENHYIRFKEASLFAKRITQDPVFRDAYMAKAKQATKNLSAYNVAMADFMHAPVIREIDNSNYMGQVGDIIKIRALDDFRVTKVEVEIQHVDGSLIEKGQAQLKPYELDWTYETGATNPSVTGSKIMVSATDIPGNTTTQVVTI